MYSVVLATMLVAGAESPTWHHHRSHCHGCFSSCHSCYSGYGSWGCYSGYGCYGSYGCYSGYACFACSQPACHCSHFRHHHHHNVGWGCYSGNWGGCYCSSGYYCSGCYCSGVVTYGCSICCGGVSGGGRVVEVPSANPEVDALRKEVERLREQLKKSEKLPLPKQEEEVANPVKTSRVTVNLPGDARLWVDGVECPLTSATRSFDTPALNVGQRYFYNMRIEVVRNGERITDSQRVVIVPGEAVRVDFNNARSIASR